MFSLGIIESIIGFMTIVFAYFFVVTVSGYFRAWVAGKMGDETPAYNGFLTFSPLKHTDPIGFVILILLGFGWGRYIPIMPFNISDPFRRLKLLIANFSDVFINLVIATVSLIGLIIYFGRHVLGLSMLMMLPDSLSSRELFGFAKSLNIIRLNLETAYPTTSPFAISITLITICVMYLSVLLAVLNFIINGFGFIYMVLKEKYSLSGRYSLFFLLVAPMLFICFFIGTLRIFVAYGITYVAAILAKLFGLY
ncbi:hypothetical protein ACFLYA_01290 [Candidatus Dependentiae bacterium]